MAQAGLERRMAKDVARLAQSGRDDALAGLDHFARALGTEKQPGADGRDR